MMRPPMSDDRTNLSAPGARQRPANVSLKQLRAFAAVAREGSFTRAAQSLFLSQSALSQHLAVLRNDGLVNTRREGQTILYALADGPALRVIETLHGIYCGADPACEV